MDSFFHLLFSFSFATSDANRNTMWERTLIWKKMAHNAFGAKEFDYATDRAMHCFMVYLWSKLNKFSAECVAFACIPTRARTSHNCFAYYYFWPLVESDRERRFDGTTFRKSEISAQRQCCAHRKSSNNSRIAGNDRCTRCRPSWLTVLLSLFAPSPPSSLAMCNNVDN